MASEAEPAIPDRYRKEEADAAQALRGLSMSAGSLDTRNHVVRRPVVRPRRFQSGAETAGAAAGDGGAASAAGGGGTSGDALMMLTSLTPAPSSGDAGGGGGGSGERPTRGGLRRRREADVDVVPAVEPAGRARPDSWRGCGSRPNHDEGTTAVLQAWLRDHWQNPYPTRAEKRELAEATGITVVQVANWFVNTRARAWRGAAAAAAAGDGGSGGGSDGSAGGGGGGGSSDDPSRKFWRAGDIPASVQLDFGGGGWTEWNAPLAHTSLTADIAVAWAADIAMPAVAREGGGGAGGMPAALSGPLRQLVTTLGATPSVAELAAGMEGAIALQREQLRHWLALLGAPTVGRPEDMLAAHIGAAEALVAREALIAKANARFTRALRAYPDAASPETTVPGGETVRRVVGIVAETSALAAAVTERLLSLKRALWDIRALRVACGTTVARGPEGAAAAAAAGGAAFGLPDLAAVPDLLREARALGVDDAHAVYATLLARAREAGMHDRTITMVGHEPLPRDIAEGAWAVHVASTLLDAVQPVDVISDALVEWDLLTVCAPRPPRVGSAEARGNAGAVHASLSRAYDAVVAWLDAVRETAARGHVDKWALEALLRRAEVIPLRVIEMERMCQSVRAHMHAVEATPTSDEGIC